MIEVVVFILAATNVALVVTLLRQQRMLFQAAMSRTPGEFRKFDQSQAVRVETPKRPEVIDEAAAMVIASMAGDSPSMPHGLGGD